MSSKVPIAPLGAGPQSEDNFQIYTQTQNIKFLTRAVQPPSQLFVDVSDDIVCNVSSSLPGEVVTVSYRLLRFDGEVILGQFILPVVGLRTITTHSEDLAEGFLLSVSCKAALATQRGQTFVRIFLTDPALGSGQPTYMLMADYVTNQFAPAYPGGRVLSPIEGPGLFKIASVANPLAGVEFLIVPPTNALWRVMSVHAILATSAVVANRTPRVAVNFGGPDVFAGGGTVTQPASKSFEYSWSGGLGFTFDGINTVVEPFPADFKMNANSQIVSNTFNLDAADQWSSINAYVEEWLQNV